MMRIKEQSSGIGTWTQVANTHETVSGWSVSRLSYIDVPFSLSLSFCPLSLSKLDPLNLERCGPEHFDTASRCCCYIAHAVTFTIGSGKVVIHQIVNKSQEVNRQFTIFTISPCFLFLPT